MAKQLLLTKDHKRVVVDRDTDVCVYNAYSNTCTRGTDLYAHKARSGKWYFYHYEWSQWQGEKCTLSLLSIAEVEAEIIMLSQNNDISEEMVERVSIMIGHDLLKEEA